MKPAILLLTTVLAIVSSCLAQGVLGTQQDFVETFDSAQSEFASYVLDGQDGAWSGGFVGGGYQLSNSSDPGAVEYVYVTGLSGVNSPLSANPISVDVSGVFTTPDYSQAGLLFNVDPETRYYYAFMVKGGNGVSLVIRNAEGFQELTSTTTDALLPGQPNRLTVATTGVTLRFLVNDIEVMSIESPSLPAGGVGIIATGTGTFSFDNFVVGALPPSSANPPPTPLGAKPTAKPSS